MDHRAAVLCRMLYELLPPDPGLTHVAIRFLANVHSAYHCA
jgi:hypothetical protein